MSFKKFSTAQDTQTKDKSDEMPKDAPVADQPAAQPDKTSDEVGPPAPKS